MITPQYSTWMVYQKSGPLGAFAAGVFHGRDGRVDFIEAMVRGEDATEDDAADALEALWEEAKEASRRGIGKVPLGLLEHDMERVEASDVRELIQNAKGGV